MTTVTTMDGAVFIGKGAKDLVRKMKQGAWNAPEGKGEYMDEVANRVWQMTGVEIRTDAEGFLQDMENLNMLTTTETN